MHLEKTPNINNPESNPGERRTDINAIGERPETRESESSPEQPLTTPEEEGKARQQEITRLTESVTSAKAKVDEIREALGLPPAKEDPPSVFSEKERLEKLLAEQEVLEKQGEELISQEERERLIRAEKENILQEKLDEIFKEFESLNASDFESIFESGKTREGRNVESPSLGELNPEIAKSLAKAFKEGIKLLPKILETLPELLRAFSEDLTKEASERVERKLKEEKQKMEEEQKKEEKTKEPKPEVSDGGIPPEEMKKELNPISSSSFEEKSSVEADLKEIEKRN